MSLSDIGLLVFMICVAIRLSWIENDLQKLEVLPLGESSESARSNYRRNPGCGSSEYSISGYKSSVAEEALQQIAERLGK